jgi:hypothetical protein
MRLEENFFLGAASLEYIQNVPATYWPDSGSEFNGKFDEKETYEQQFDYSPLSSQALMQHIALFSF